MTYHSSGIRRGIYEQFDVDESRGVLEDRRISCQYLNYCLISSGAVSDVGCEKKHTFLYLIGLTKATKHYKTRPPPFS